MVPIYLPEKFLVAFSLAGEQRELVRPVAVRVAQELGRDRVFFDEWYEHYIAGHSGDQRLTEIYRNCILAIICVSGHYGSKPWIVMEHEAIRSRVFAAKDSVDRTADLAILPIRVGDGEVEGIFFNTIVPDVRDKGPDATAELIIRRLDMVQGRSPRKPEPLPPPDIEVKHIDSFDANKGMIEDALTLYKKQIAEDEQVDLDDLIDLIRRYLSGYYAPRFLLHFFVAIFGRQVVGMLMCYEDTEANFAFVPYAAALKPLRGARNPQHITRELGIGLMKARRRLNLPPLRLLFEADDPRLAENKERGRRESRIKLFDSLGAPYEGLRLRALDLRYLQPKLEWPGKGREKEILLFIAAPGLQSMLHRKKAVEILTWAYTELYGGKIFDQDPPTRAEFRKYTLGLLDSILPTLPGSVRLLRCRDLVKPAKGPGG